MAGSDRDPDRDADARCQKTDCVGTDQGEPRTPLPGHTARRRHWMLSTSNASGRPGKDGEYGPETAFAEQPGSDQTRLTPAGMVLDRLKSARMATPATHVGGLKAVWVYGQADRRVTGLRWSFLGFMLELEGGGSVFRGQSGSDPLGR